MDKSISFLQSEAWGEVQQAYGRTVQRINHGGQVVQAIRYPLTQRQWYWFIPYGPYVTGLADGAVFVRFEPELPPVQGRAVADVHPRMTLLTPLKDETTMLANCKQKCRYNIRLAQKKQLHVEASTDVETFYNLLDRTAQKQGIRLHPKQYYQTMVEVLKRYDMAKIYIAYQNKKPLAAACMIYHRDTVTYVHGGSDYSERATMAPYALHWQAMCDAAKEGFKFYDWFGIAPADQPNHPFAGITRFKSGFGGQVRQRAGTYELALRPLWYTGYRLAKQLWT